MYLLSYSAYVQELTDDFLNLITFCHSLYLIQQVETCQEKIISLELEDPKSLESPLSPTTEEFINAQLKQRLRMSSEEESDDKDSMVTVRPNSSDIDNFVLQPTNPEDFINANIVTASEYHDEDDVRTTSVQTIVEVVNPLLAGDGTATEIAIGKSANVDMSNLAFDDDDIDSVEVVYRNEISLNDKMKNVLRELKENEKVRLSLSRSMEDEDEDLIAQDEGDGDEVTEKKQGANGTLFMVRERLINDFYDHTQSGTSADVNMANVEERELNDEHSTQATIFANPSAVDDEFLANEIRHAQETSSSNVVENNSLRARKEALTLDLKDTASRTADDGETPEIEDEGEDETPTTPTATAGGKRRRRKNKNKKK